jgi:hypothetical protein
MKRKLIATISALGLLFIGGFVGVAVATPTTSKVPGFTIQQVTDTAVSLNTGIGITLECPEGTQPESGWFVITRDSDGAEIHATAFASHPWPSAGPRKWGFEVETTVTGAKTGSFTVLCIG